MTVSVYLPLAISLLLAAGSRLLARRLSPASAAASLVAASVLSAASSVWGLALLASTLLGQAPPVSERVAARGVRIAQPVPTVIAVMAALALLVGLTRAARVVSIRRAAGRDLRALCAASRGTGELVVAAVDTAQAFAVPGRPGRILVSRGMLRALNAVERRVLFAHERAHLRGHHHGQRAAAEVAAALNPLLGPARTAVAFLLERSADEHAAAVVGSRSITARSLGIAALAGGGPAPAGALAYQRLTVSDRVAALRAPPLPARPAVIVAVLVLGLATTAAAIDATVAFTRLLAVLLPF